MHNIRLSDVIWTLLLFVVGIPVMAVMVIVMGLQKRHRMDVPAPTRRLN